MARKDANSNHCSPVDNYRKQIGKQDWKKSKKEVKSMRNKGDTEYKDTTQQIVLTMALFVLVMSSIYVFFLWQSGHLSLMNLRAGTPV